MLFTQERKATSIKLASWIEVRDYQQEALDTGFRQFGDGCEGVLLRLFTGAGKTITGCMFAEKWLEQGPEYRVMVIAHERQLIWQFADEIEDVLNYRPAIEMADRVVGLKFTPAITVASRATLACKKLATPEQRAKLEAFGVKNLRLTTQDLAKTLLRVLVKGVDRDAVQDAVDRHNESWMTNHQDGKVSRLYKFDPLEYNWLVIWDECHRHVNQLKTVRDIVQHFGKNPMNRRVGLSATPKRGDGVSLQKMFPGVAVDYPLFRLNERCAVREGYAVPYDQRFITVPDVDFKNLRQVAGDFRDDELEEILGREETLAKLIEPTLDLIGDRRLLCFSPGVEMAKNVARYINARSKCKCECGKVQWVANHDLRNGTECRGCLAPLTNDNRLTWAPQAEALDGSIPDQTRKDVYQRHQRGEFQVLSVCGLCREGYNDPDLGAVAVYRPVSKAASSLAEQMKGRACRPLRGLLNGLATADERLAAIAGSSKPNAMIIDLVGITGLPDCSSTVQIMAEGKSDEVIDRANAKIMAAVGPVDIEEVIRQVEKEMQDEADAKARREQIERDKVKAEREAREREAQKEADRASKLGATVTYEQHQVAQGDGGYVHSKAKRQGWRMLYGPHKGKLLEDCPLPYLRAAIPHMKHKGLKAAAERVVNGTARPATAPGLPTPDQQRLVSRWGMIANTYAEAVACIGKINERLRNGERPKL